MAAWRAFGTAPDTKCVVPGEALPDHSVTVVPRRVIVAVAFAPVMGVGVMAVSDHPIGWDIIAGLLVGVGAVGVAALIVAVVAAIGLGEPPTLSPSAACLRMDAF